MRKLLVFLMMIKSLSSYAQDNTYFGSDALKQGWIINPTGLLLPSKTIKDTGVRSFVENIVFSLPEPQKNCVRDTCILPNHILLDSCRFLALKTYHTRLYFTTADVNHFKTDYSFSIQNSVLTGEAAISNMYLNPDRPFAWVHDSVQALHVNFSNGWFDIEGSAISGKIYFDQCRLSNLTIDQNNFTQQDTATIEIQNSVIKRLSAAGNHAKNIRYYFKADSLLSDFSISRLQINDQKVDSGGVALFLFQNCYLNGSLQIAESSKTITVQFVNCSFGVNFNLNELDIDSLVFDNCTKFAEPVDLNQIRSAYLHVSFMNTELKNFRFNYLGQFQLYFPAATSDEYRISTFENLLAKFKLEGKLKSYQNIDIEYTQFQNSQNGTWGAVVDFIDRAWWYYGYRKYYILYWTVGFLLFFFVLNIRWWEQVQQVYPIIPSEQHSYYDRLHFKTNKRLRHLTNIFVFTAFIFFSLRVDFDKLSYKKSRLLAYFFVQYILGLACVFFIANAILKI